MNTINIQRSNESRRQVMCPSIDGILKTNESNEKDCFSLLLYTMGFKTFYDLKNNIFSNSVNHSTCDDSILITIFQ